MLPTSINGNLQSTYIFAVAIALVLQWHFQVLLDSVIYLLTIKLATFKKIRFVYNILEVVITFIDNTYHYYYAKERPTYFNGQLGSSWFNRFFFFWKIRLKSIQITWAGYLLDYVDRKYSPATAVRVRILRRAGEASSARTQCDSLRRVSPRSKFRRSRPLIYISPIKWVNNCPRSAPPSAAVHLATPNHCSPNV